LRIQPNYKIYSNKRNLQASVAEDNFISKKVFSEPFNTRIPFKARCDYVWILV